LFSRGASRSETEGSPPFPLHVAEWTGNDRSRTTQYPEKTYMLRKLSMLLVFALVGAAGALAQNPRGRSDGRSTITVAVDGFTCNNNQGTIPALSWSFGVTTPTQTNTGGGGSAGKANLSDLSLTRRADGCTPFLFAASVTGKIFKTVTVVQQDQQKDDTFTVTLQDVIISSYQLGGDHGNEVPSEQIGFSYEKICVADNGSGTKACWDLAQQRAF
jgi:type VI secretion system Hcp family effector